MSEKPLERLNYYNGQRLEAADLRLEQDYHIRIQRVMAKSLFSPGVGDGLEVSIDDTDNHYVLVSPGLALDDLGRAIVLAAAKRIKVQAPYLCVRYAEQSGQPQDGSCVVRSGSSMQQAEWGGPSRVISEPQFVWRRNYPINDVREIAIAKLEMKKEDPCVAVRVEEGPHQMAVATQVSAVYSYALEGARDLDSANHARVYFHIRGRQPNSVTLYLRAEKFPTFHYTEMGKHNHDRDARVSKRTGPASEVDAHLHKVVPSTVLPLLDGQLMTENSGAHGHTVTSRISRFGNAPSDDSLTGIVVLPTIGYDAGTWPFPDIVRKPISGGTSNLSLVAFTVINSAGHTHPVRGSVGDTKARPDGGDEALRHTHPISDAGVDAAIPAYHARGGTPLGYVNDLQIWIGKDSPAEDRTADVLKRLDEAARENVGSQKWAGTQTLGNGSAGHVFVEEGTGAIRLDVLPGLSFTDGEYYLEFRAPKKTDGAGNSIPNGGRILYNLYIE